MSPKDNSRTFQVVGRLRGTIFVFLEGWGINDQFYNLFCFVLLIDCVTLDDLELSM